MSTKIDSNHKKDSNHKSALDISRAAPFDSHAVKFVKLRNFFAFNMASAVEGIVRIIHRTLYLAWYPVSSNSSPLCNRKKRYFQGGWRMDELTQSQSMRSRLISFPFIRHLKEEEWKKLIFNWMKEIETFCRRYRYISRPALLAEMDDGQIKRLRGS